MPWTELDKATIQGNGATLPGGTIHVPTATLFLAWVTAFGDDGGTITCTNGQSFEPGANVSSFPVSGRFHYLLNPNVGSPVNFQIAGTAPSCLLYVYEESAGNAFDNETTQIAAGGGSSILLPTLTPVLPGSLFFAGLGYGSANTPSIDSSFASPDIAADIPAVAVPAAASTKVSSTAEAPTWSISGANAYSAALMAFSPGGGAPVIFVPPLIVHPSRGPIRPVAYR